MYGAATFLQVSGLLCTHFKTTFAMLTLYHFKIFCLINAARLLSKLASPIYAGICVPCNSYFATRCTVPLKEPVFWNHAKHAPGAGGTRLFREPAATAAAISSCTHLRQHHHEFSIPAIFREARGGYTRPMCVECQEQQATSASRGMPLLCT